MYEEEYARLHGAVCDRPEYDAPRVDFADFIEPHDPDRARFIRLQIDRVRRRPDLRRIPSPGPLEGQLLHRHRETWSQTVSPLVIPTAWRGHPGYGFGRGFVSYLRLRTETFIARCREISSLAPIEHVDFCGPTGHRQGPSEGFPLEEWVACEGLSRLVSIEIEYRLTQAQFEAIAHCPHLKNCRYLDIASTGLDAEEQTFRTLAASPLGANLVSISTYPGPLGEIPDTDEDSRPFFGPPSALTLELIAAHGDRPWMHPSRYVERYAV